MASNRYGKKWTQYDLIIRNPRDGCELNHLNLPMISPHVFVDRFTKTHLLHRRAQRRTAGLNYDAHPKHSINLGENKT